jgi:hypothetical protein
MANHLNSGALAGNASYGVSMFSSFSVYAANASTVTLTAGAKTATYTVGSSGVLTVTDQADSVSCNNAFVVVGLVSTTVD